MKCVQNAEILLLQEISTECFVFFLIVDGMVKMFKHLRHVGIQTTDLERDIRHWQAVGFEPLEVLEFRFCKVVNKWGVMMELIEGDYDPHFSVTWHRDENGNLFEIVEEVKCP